MVDKAAAREILTQVLRPLRALSHEELMERYLNKPETMTVPQASGPCYQIEIEGFWDDRRSGNLRLIASIDDGSG